MSTVPQGVNRVESQQPSLYAAGIVTYVLAILAVGLRFWSRWLKKAGWWLDDWLVVAALVREPIPLIDQKTLTEVQVVSGASLVDLLLWINKASAITPNDGPDGFYYFFLFLFVGELTYTGILCLVKYAILALYWRIFQRTNIRTPIYVLAGIVTCWGLAVIITTCLQCIPTAGFWDKRLDASCSVNPRNFLLGLSIPNILTNVTLLVLPVPYILQLNVGSGQKAALGGMFLLGGFVCIASIIRPISVMTLSEADPDLTWNITPLGIWTMVECNLAIFSVCLPCLRPVWSFFLTGSADGTISNSSHGVGDTSFSKRKKMWNFPRGTSSKAGPAHPFTTLQEGNSSKDYASKRSIGGEGIGLNTFPKNK